MAYFGGREGSTSEHTLLILSQLINPRNIDTPKNTHEFRNCQSDPAFQYVPVKRYGEGVGCGRLQGWA